MKYHCPLYITMNHQAIETACSLVLETTVPLVAPTIACRLFLPSEIFFLSPLHSLNPSILESKAQFIFKIPSDPCKLLIPFSGFHRAIWLNLDTGQFTGLCPCFCSLQLTVVHFPQTRKAISVSYSVFIRKSINGPQAPANFTSSKKRVFR